MAWVYVYNQVNSDEYALLNMDKVLALQAVQVDSTPHYGVIAITEAGTQFGVGDNTDCLSYGFSSLAEAQSSLVSILSQLATPTVIVNGAS